MVELSIKIKLGELEYAMKINPTEEERIRRAGRVINDKIKTYREQYGSLDFPYLMGMIALDAVANTYKTEEQQSSISVELEQEIDKLLHTLE